MAKSPFAALGDRPSRTHRTQAIEADNTRRSRSSHHRLKRRIRIIITPPVIAYARQAESVRAKTRNSGASSFPSARLFRF